jgi:hypothetical protein
MALIKPLPVLNIPQLIGQGLQGFQAVKGIQQRQAQADREEQIAGLLQGSQTDPQKLAQLALLDPQRARGIQQFQQGQSEEARITQERFERDRAFIAQAIEGKPLEEQLVVVDQQIRNVLDRGGDPSNTQGLRDLLVGTPEQNAQAQVFIRNARIQGENQGFIKRQEQPKPESRTSLAKNIELLRDPNLSQEERQIVLNNLAGPQQRVEINPDGSIVFRSGKGVGDPTKPTKSVMSTLQKQAVQMRRDLSAFDQIEKRYKKEFLTIKGVARSKVASIKSFLGVDVDPEDVEFTKERRTFTQPVQQLFNRYLNEFAGVRVIADELKRQQEAMINNQQAPIIFEAALAEGKAAAQRGLRLVNKLLREGVTGNLKNKNSPISKAVSSAYQGGEDDTAEARSAELEAEGLSDEQIRELLTKDGYL